MKLFRMNAEQLLFEKARSIDSERNSWRCIYINFSEHEERFDLQTRMDIVTGIVKEILKDDEGHIYLCKDGDVFILFQGKLTPIINRLSSYFSGLGRNDENKLYAVFDLSRDWQVFIALCKAKAKANQLSHQSDSPPSEQAPPTFPPASSLSEVDVTLFRTAVAKQADRKRPLVLVVEDDAFTRRLLKVTLRADYDIVEAGSGQEAIQVYARCAPDVVFLDIELPDFSGQTVLNKILSFDKKAFIVMLSAHSFRENILASLEKGAQGFVSKPFAREKLIHYLHVGYAAKHGQVTTY